MPNRGQRLREARSAVYRSARQAAFALGVPVATYNAHEHAQQPGGRDYTPEEAAVYAKHFGARVEFLLMGNVPAAEIVSEGSTVPVVGSVGAAGLVQWFPKNRIRQAPIISGSTEKTVAVELRIGTNFDYWLAYYDDLREPLVPRLFGKPCVVEVSDGRVYMRHLKQGARRGFVHLLGLPLADRTEPITDVRLNWAAHVHTLHDPRSGRHP